MSGLVDVVVSTENAPTKYNHQNCSFGNALDNRRIVNKRLAKNNYLLEYNDKVYFYYNDNNKQCIQHTWSTAGLMYRRSFD